MTSVERVAQCLEARANPRARPFSVHCSCSPNAPSLQSTNQQAPSNERASLHTLAWVRDSSIYLDYDIRAIHA